MPDRPADRRKDERAAALQTGPGQSWRQHRPIAPKKKPDYEQPPGFAQRMMISQQIIGKHPKKERASRWPGGRPMMRSDLLIAAFVINEGRPALAHAHRLDRPKHYIVRGHRLGFDGAAIE